MESQSVANPLHKEAQQFLSDFLHHCPNLEEYAILLIAIEPDEEKTYACSATKHVSDGMDTSVVKTFVEALVNLLIQERGEDDTAYATRH